MGKPRHVGHIHCTAWDGQRPVPEQAVKNAEFIAAAPQLVRDLLSQLRAVPQEPGWRAYVQHKQECWLRYETRDLVPNPPYCPRFRQPDDGEPVCTCGLAEILDPPSPAQAEET